MAEPTKVVLLRKIEALEREIRNTSEIENKWHEAEIAIAERDREISRLQEHAKKLDQTIDQLHNIIDNNKNIIDNQTVGLTELETKNINLKKELNQTKNSLQLVVQQNNQYSEQSNTIRNLTIQIEALTVEIRKYRKFLSQLIQPLSSFQEFNGEVLATIQSLLKSAYPK